MVASLVDFLPFRTHYKNGGTMHSIEFISFDKEGKPKTKTFKGEHIKELLEDPSKPGQIVQELNQEEK